MNIKKLQARDIGYMAECWVAYELAKRDIRCQRTDKDVLDCDFITEFGDLIEVKCARPHWSWNGAKTSKTLIWGFNNYKNTYSYKDGNYMVKRKGRDRNCDFFILLGLKKDCSIDKVFIVPKEEIGTRLVINEPVNRKHKRKDITICLSDWEDRWDLITRSSAKAKDKNGR